jgi:hypothetical protein
VLKFIDPVFTKTSPKQSFSVIENENFGLVFAKTGSINSGNGLQQNPIPSPLAYGYGGERVEPKRRGEGQHRTVQIPKLV